ncbi:hypothetical protein KN825_16835, partial [Weizmannia coagulans]|nr:hypothetical protein [Heyndrickxia coagulans]
GGPLEIYNPKTKKWSSHNAYIEGQPGIEPAKRSVHGLVQYVGRNATINIEKQEKQVVAIMFMGEGEGAPKEVGHDGAGKVSRRSDSGGKKRIILI